MNQHTRRKREVGRSRDARTILASPLLPERSISCYNPDHPSGFGVLIICAQILEVYSDIAFSPVAPLSIPYSTNPRVESVVESDKARISKMLTTFSHVVQRCLRGCGLGGTH